MHAVEAQWRIVKILFSSHTFFPNVGGVETVSVLLADEFSALGHDVTVITETPAAGLDQEFPFNIVRRPSAGMLIQLTRWADVVFHNNISLRVAWPLLFVRRPWVVAHHIWLPRGLRTLFKRIALRGAEGIAISDAIAADFGTACTVIPDPYDDVTFRLMPEIERNHDLVFVGRFVTDKGLPVLLDALVLLAKSGLQPGLTVIGSGPEEQSWRRQVQRLGLSTQVKFAGVKRGVDLAEALNGHRVMVVPSLWEEPFGVVALEGMACGCLVLGSEGGGLKQAIGPGGATFSNGDASGCAALIEWALRDPAAAYRCTAAASAHLALHHREAVAQRYLTVLNQSVT